jgi:hypothetical protein
LRGPVGRKRRGVGAELAGADKIKPNVFVIASGAKQSSTV